MVDIVREVHRYVPGVEYTAVQTIESTDEEVPVKSAVFHKTLFGGDQLTAARQLKNTCVMLTHLQSVCWDAMP